MFFTTTQAAVLATIAGSLIATTSAVPTNLHARKAQDGAPGPTAPGTAGNCQTWHMVVGGDGCWAIANAAGISLSDFYSWNPDVNNGGECKHLMAGYAVCIGTGGGGSTTPPPPTGNTGGPSVSGNGVNWYQSNPNQGGNVGAGYQCFSGPAGNYPAQSQWVSFDSMWSGAQQVYLNNRAADTAAKQAVLKQAILDVSSASKVDARFILAVVLQESNGQIDVQCTQGFYLNCGLMQASDGSVQYDGSDGSIVHMLQDGVQGTKGMTQGGYVQILNGGMSQGNPYIAARIYNSGEGGTHLDNLNYSPGESTSSYVVDIANRLVGWTGAQNRLSC